MTTFSLSAASDHHSVFARWLSPVDETGTGFTAFLVSNVTDNEQVLIPIQAESGRRLANGSEVDSTTSTVETANGWEQTSSEGSVTGDRMLQLEFAAQAMDRATFESLSRIIDWSRQPVGAIIHAARLALTCSAHRVARRIVEQGSEQYPEHEELEKMTRILAPPRISSAPDVRPSGWKANRAWLQRHQEAFRGKWVALRDGELLASADTMRSLLEQTGDVRGKNILVTLVS